MTLLNILETAGNVFKTAGTVTEEIADCLNGLCGQTGGYEVLSQYPNCQMSSYGFRQPPVIQPIVFPTVFIQPQPQPPYFYNCGQVQPNVNPNYGMNRQQQPPYSHDCGQVQPNVSPNYGMNRLPQQQPPYSHDCGQAQPNVNPNYGMNQPPQTGYYPPVKY